jgi:rhodanese-related sulfurtransferase
VNEFELPMEKARQLHEAGEAQFVDVREKYEWDAGRMPGARWIPLAHLAEDAKTLDPTRPIVFVCRVGARSGFAAQQFRSAGYDAYNLTGGLEAWVAEGLPLDPPDGYVAPH